jgi:hypothetical protein
LTVLAGAEVLDLENTTLITVKDFIRDLHSEQERTGKMTYLRRLDEFLIPMEEYENVVQAAEIFVNVTEAVAYLWVSCAPSYMK